MESSLRLLAYCLVAGAFMIALCGDFRAQAQVEVPAPVESKHRADTECEDHDIDHMVKARQSGKLDENHLVYLLPCFTGAYNVIYRIYVFDKRYPDEVKPSAFAGFSDELGWFGQTQLINAEFDEKTKTLTAFEKGRGLGDCGSIPSYQWHEYGWRLLEYRHWGKCDGSRMPAEWPVIYRYKPQ